jgi:alanyl-tRNA synthetase
LVNDQLLRFDFLHPSNLSSKELTQVEGIVNQKIRDNIVLQEQQHLSLSAAKAMGAVALFGERYGKQVRSITFDPTFSVELCGGTHVPATGQLGFFKITANTAVAAGVRRIVAVTAVAAERLVHQQLSLLGTLQALLKHPQDPQKALQQLLQEKVLLSKKLATHEAAQVQIITDQLCNKLHKIYGIHTLIAQVALPHIAALKQVTLALQELWESHFVVLAAVVEQKPHIAVALSEDLAQRWSQNAQDIVKKLAKYIQGGGGGSPTFATAGGKDMGSLPQVLRMAEEILEQNMAK